VPGANAHWAVTMAPLGKEGIDRNKRQNNYRPGRQVAVARSKRVVGHPTKSKKGDDSTRKMWGGGRGERQKGNAACGRGEFQELVDRP